MPFKRARVLQVQKESFMITKNPLVSMPFKRARVLQVNQHREKKVRCFLRFNAL